MYLLLNFWYKVTMKLTFENVYRSSASYNVQFLIYYRSDLKIRMFKLPIQNNYSVDLRTRMFKEIDEMTKDLN